MPEKSISRNHTIYTIAIIGFIYTLHLVIPMYSNSSFLSLFADERTVGFIYMISAAVSILSFLLAPSLIRKLGNYAVSLWLIFIQMGLFWGLIIANDPKIVAGLFILQSAVISLIGLTLDIFLEKYSDGMHVGKIRGLYMTTLNTSWIIAPLIGSLLVNGGDNYRHTYIAGLTILFPLFYLIFRNLPRFKDPNYTHLSPWQLIKKISVHPNIVRIFFANILLYIFYAWMVIYSPIYLHKTIGFSWEEVGLILVIILLPFALIQYRLGELADKRYGEKEMMALGFLLMGLATIGLSFIHTANIWLWIGILLLTRIGAATVEIMIETYFFKTVSERDNGMLGMFRITRPLANFIAPIITIVGVMFFAESNIFIILGAICLLAIYPALRLKDTL